MFVQCQLKLLSILMIIYSAATENETENPLASAVRKSMVATAKSCMTHVNATQEDLELLRKDPPYPEKSSCIIMCLLEKVGVIKNNRFSKTGFMLAVSPLIITRQKKIEHMRTVSENCDKECSQHKYHAPLSYLLEEKERKDRNGHRATPIAVHIFRVRWWHLPDESGSYSAYSTSAVIKAWTSV